MGTYNNAYETLELIETISEGVLHIKENGLEVNTELFDCILEALEAVINEASKISDETISARLEAMHGNLYSSYNEISEYIVNNQFSEAEWRYVCGFMPLILHWCRYIKYLFLYKDNNEKLEQFRLNEKNKLEKLRTKKTEEVEKKEYKYDLSIIVLFYNNKDMTEECIDNIIEYTKGVTYELITFNHGSDENTTEWANTLKHKKNVHYKYNMGASQAGNIIMSSCDIYTEGKYVVFISNDVIVTENWASNLIKCIESDNKIAFAVPVCNSLSNMQIIPVEYKTQDEMHEFARKYNISDSSKWEERARLFPFMGIFRSKIINELGYFLDFYFSYDMFADDDLSVRVRRAGYKQILCLDTFVHHYGSATIAESQYEVMEIGRKQFYEKYNVDAWNSLGGECWVYSKLVSEVNGENLKMLAVNPDFGEGVLAVKNSLKKNGIKEIAIDGVVEDFRYLEDVKSIAENTYMVDEFEYRDATIKYDLIIFNNYFEEYNDFDRWCSIINKVVKTNGMVLLKIKNPSSLKWIIKSLNILDINEQYLVDPHKSPVYKYISPQGLKNVLSDYGLKFKQIISVRGSYEAGEELSEVLASKLGIDDVEQLRKNMEIDEYICLISKE